MEKFSYPKLHFASLHVIISRDYQGFFYDQYEIIRDGIRPIKDLKYDISIIPCHCTLGHIAFRKNFPLTEESLWDVFTQFSVAM